MEELKELRKIAIQALVSDDELMDKLILKGGNALELIYNISERASFDLDFSIEQSFDDDNLEELKTKISKLLDNAFNEHGYKIFDFNLYKRPVNLSPDLNLFWGGYKIEFKIMDIEEFDAKKHDMDKVRKSAKPIGASRSTKFKIEISRYEYCPSIQEKEIEGYLVKVYSPLLIAIEKLRAICQQMDEYKKIIGSSNICPRARDFFDIYTILETCKIDMNTPENITILKDVFDAKKVPLNFLKELSNYRDFHSEDFVSVKDTVKQDVELKEFDYYFDYILKVVSDLEI